MEKQLKQREETLLPVYQQVRMWFFSRQLQLVNAGKGQFTQAIFAASFGTISSFDGCEIVVNLPDD